MTDEELLRRAAGGEETAFLLLYERHRASVYGFAYRLHNSREAAEDLTQECFLSLIGRPERFQANCGSLRAYLLGAVRNLSLKRFRQSAREADCEASEDIAASEPDPLNALIELEAEEAVRQAVAALPDGQREVVLLFDYEGLPLAEIAGILEIDVGTVKSRLFRARQRLRRQLAPLLT